MINKLQAFNSIVIGENITINEPYTFAFGGFNGTPIYSVEMSEEEYRTLSSLCHRAREVNQDTKEHIKELQREVGELSDELDEKQRLLSRLKYALEKEEDLKFFAENNITRENIVFFRRKDGTPFMSVFDFIEYLKSDRKANKPWCEWNGVIYNTAEFLENWRTEKYHMWHEDY